MAIVVIRSNPTKDLEGWMADRDPHGETARLATVFTVLKTRPSAPLLRGSRAGGELWEMLSRVATTITQITATTTRSSLFETSPSTPKSQVRSRGTQDQRHCRTTNPSE